MSRHYLDHASTSPPRPAVADAVAEWFQHSAPRPQPQPQPADADFRLAGDPGRIHEEGMAARVEIENARETVADFLGARSREVVFNSGATESIAAATWGAAERGDQIVLSAVEHSAVRFAASALETQGTHTVTVVGVDSVGRVDVAALIEAVDSAAERGGHVALVHIQLANHEVGTIQPVEEVVAACEERGVLVHVDAAAAAGHIPIDFKTLGCDLMSISAHQCGGPPGIGALLIRRGLRLRSLLVGGEQERARRAGYENVPAILGFAALCAQLDNGVFAAEAARARAFTDRVTGALGALEGFTVYGDPLNRLPHLVCLGIDGVEPQPVVLGLDQAGIAVHSGSSCSSEALEPSPVLAAMGVDAHRSMRISTGWNTTEADIDALLEVLPDVVGRLRTLGAQIAK